MDLKIGVKSDHGFQFDVFAALLNAAASPHLVVSVDSDADAAKCHATLNSAHPSQRGLLLPSLSVSSELPSLSVQKSCVCVVADWRPTSSPHPSSSYSFSSSFSLLDPQSEPQRHLSDQLPGRVQVHSWTHGFSEARQVPGGHHLHREHRRH